MIKDLLTIIPNADYYKRGTYDLKKVNGQFPSTDSILPISFNKFRVLILAVNFRLWIMLTTKNTHLLSSSTPAAENQVISYSALIHSLNFVL